MILKTKIGFISVSFHNSFITSLEFLKEGVESNVSNLVSDQLTNYFNNTLKEFDLKVKVDESSFSKQVFKELENIKYGDTITYKELALRLNKPNHTRAVANVLKNNKVPIIRPCHRVVSKNDINGYLAGKSIKKYLLDLESVNI